jgi:hypothetical protein
MKDLGRIEYKHSINTLNDKFTNSLIEGIVVTSVGYFPGEETS